MCVNSQLEEFAGLFLISKSLYSLSSSCVYLQYCGSSGGSSTLQTLFLFSVAPRHLEYAGSYSCSEIAETEASALDGHLKSLNIGCIFQSSLFLPREKPGAWSLAGGGSLVDDCILVQSTIILSDPQASGICHVPSALQDR